MGRKPTPKLLPLLRSRQQGEILARLLGDPELEASVTDIAAMVGVSDQFGAPRDRTGTIRRHRHEPQDRQRPTCASEHRQPLLPGARRRAGEGIRAPAGTRRSARRHRRHRGRVHLRVVGGPLVGRPGATAPSATSTPWFSARRTETRSMRHSPAPRSNWDGRCRSPCAQPTGSPTEREVSMQPLPAGLWSKSTALRGERPQVIFFADPSRANYPR